MRSMATTVLALLLAPAWVELGGSGTGGGVSHTGGSSNYPSLAIDASGKPWVVWEELGGGGRAIFLRHWNGSAWVGLGGSDSGAGLSNSPGSAQTPSLVLDSADRPVVAWSHNLGIYVHRWDGTAWVPYGNSDTGLGLAGGESAFSPKIRLDAADRPVVLWQQNPSTTGGGPPPPSQIYVKRWNGTSWEELGGSATGGGISNAGAFAETPDLAVDAAGNPVAAWSHAETFGNGLQIYVKRWNGVSWVDYGGSGTGTGMSGSGSSGSSPSAAIDTFGNPVIAWHEYNLSASPFGEIYLRRWDGSSWVEIGGSATAGGVSAAGGAGARFASLKLDASNHPTIAWQNGPVYTTDEIYVRRWNGTGWVEAAGSATGVGVSATPAVSSGFASLALTPSGDPGVAWAEGFSNVHPSNPAIYYRQLGSVPDPSLTVTAMAPAPGSVLEKHPTAITVTLSQPPDPTTVNGVSVTLVHAGKDNRLGTADDVELHPAVSLTGATIKLELCRLKLSKGAYRLRVRGSEGHGPGGAVRGTSGNLLDGEYSGAFPSGNGTAGGDFVADFTLKK